MDLDLDEQEETLYADGFESALLGHVHQFNRKIAVYNYDACIRILMDRDGMSHEDAVEFMDFNVLSAWIGPYTPAFTSEWVS